MSLVSGTEHEETVAKALDDAQMACEALRPDDALRPLMLDVLRTITTRLQPTLEQWALGAAPRGTRPGVPNRWRYLHRLDDAHAAKPLRKNVYEAMDALLELIWPKTEASSSTERSRKARADKTYRDQEIERNELSQHKKAMKLLNSGVDTEADWDRYVHDQEHQKREAEQEAARQRRLDGLKKWREQQAAAPAPAAAIAAAPLSLPDASSTSAPAPASADVNDDSPILYTYDEGGSVLSATPLQSTPKRRTLSTVAEAEAAGFRPGTREHSMAATLERMAEEMREIRAKEEAKRQKAQAERAKAMAAEAAAAEAALEARPPFPCRRCGAMGKWKDQCVCWRALGYSCPDPTPYGPLCHDCKRKQCPEGYCY